MKKRLSFFMLLSLFVHYNNLSNAQNWVEDYLYNGSELNSEKWGPGRYSGPEPIATFTGDVMNLKTRWDSSVSSPTFDGTYIFQKEWYKNVPINQSWSLLQRIQPVYEPMSYFSTGIYVRSSDNLLSAYLAYEYFQYGDNQNNGQASYRDGVAAQYPLETWGYRWIGLSYDSSNSILRSFYSLNTSSEISSSFDFVTLSERTISSNLAESLIVGQESHFYRANGNVNISDFKITSYAVPEPSALSLLAVGLGGLAMMLRRRS